MENLSEQCLLKKEIQLAINYHANLHIHMFSQMCKRKNLLIVTSTKLLNIYFEPHHVSCKEHCFQIKIKIPHGATFCYFLASCIALWPLSLLDCDPNMLLAIASSKRNVNKNSKC
jgi:hypothetical protein